MTETIIAIAIILLAVAYLIWVYIKRDRSKPCNSACASCQGAPKQEIIADCEKETAPSPDK
ncbi:MAG: FeoB-associated Cys-rich membrane protein [Desulfovibrio sp.]|nr:MAG: FeoB-associated Cys-rich membrane protein [Desulfovibrio sp.]